MPFWTWRRRLTAGIAVVLLLALGWATVVVAVALAAARDQATAADAIAVLGAAQYNGRPSPVFKARLDHAATLYLRGYAPVVLVTGGVGARDSLSEAEVGRTYLRNVGVPAEAAIALPVASTSYASLDRVAGWFAGKSSRRVILVSD